MKKIYILSTYTGTMLAYLIKRKTKVPYPHVSIGLDKNLEEVYSFGRLHVSNPIFAGFVREYIDSGLYKKKSDTLCRVYSIALTDEQYSSFMITLNYFTQNGKNFKYDSKALFRFLYKKPKQNDTKYVCSQFVAYLLEESNVNIFYKPSYLVTPLDFYQLNDLTIEYEGLLSEYRNSLSKKEKTRNLFLDPCIT